MKYLRLIAQKHSSAYAMVLAITVVCIMLKYESAYFVNETPHQFHWICIMRTLAIDDTRIIKRIYFKCDAIKTKEYIPTKYWARYKCIRCTYRNLDSDDIPNKGPNKCWMTMKMHTKQPTKYIYTFSKI